MKKLMITPLWLLISYAALSQEKHHDSLAILIIDRMTDVIGDLQSCSFKLTAANDVRDSSSGWVKHFSDFDVYFSGASKMLINVRGHKGHRQFMYNGEQLAYYSFRENNYGIIPTPATTIETIDSVYTNYGYEFPAADFFYPAFTDDLLQDAETLRFLGTETIHGKEYFHILASGKKTDFQFWVTNDAYNLPGRFVITYKSEPGSPQYQASFSDWQINPTLPDAMFDFLPPPNATKVRIMSKTDASPTKF